MFKSAPLMLMFVLLMLTGITQAQEESAAGYTTFVSPEGTLQFSYPQDWVVQDNFEPQAAMLATSKTLLQSALNYKYSDSSTVHIPNNQMFAQLMVVSKPEDYEYSKLQDPVLQAFPNAVTHETFIGGRQALIIQFEVTHDYVPIVESGEIILIVLDVGEQLALIMAIANIGQIAEFEQEILSLANSLQLPYRGFGESQFFTATFDNLSPFYRLFQQGISPWYEGQIEGGYYQLISRKPSWLRSIVQNVRPYRNAHITLRIHSDAETVSGEYRYGILYRYEDTLNHYLFEISTSGVYALKIIKDGQWESWAEASSIPADTASNEKDDTTLEVIFEDDQFTGLINGNIVVTASDSTFQSGGVGIFLTSDNDTDAVLLIDEFQIQPV